jgi:hypothetical protein
MVVVADHWILWAVRLRLDLQRFDATQFSAYPRRCEQSEIAVTTMADLGIQPSAGKRSMSWTRRARPTSPATVSSRRLMSTWGSAYDPPAMTRRALSWR